MLPKSFSMTAVKCFYETESDIWDGLGRFGSLEFSLVLIRTVLSTAYKFKPFAVLFSLEQP